MQSRCNVIHDVGYLEFGSTSSLEMLVMADELVAMSRHFHGGIPVNQETLALEVIERVALEREESIFLTDPHTFQNFRQAQFLPRLIDRTRHKAWADAGEQDLYERCNAEARRLLSEHRVEPKPEGWLEDVYEIIAPPRKAATA
jgi:trimethylamine--corrinoid protein Co-methyltransferase